MDTEITRRRLMLALGASASAWFLPRTASAPELRAAERVAAALDLDTLAPLAARMTNDAGPALGPLLIRLTALSAEAILTLTPARLREQVRSLALDDYAHGRIERIGGWWLSTTEVLSLDLAARVRRLPSG